MHQATGPTLTMNLQLGPWAGQAGPRSVFPGQLGTHA